MKQGSLCVPEERIGDRFFRTSRTLSEGFHAPPPAHFQNSRTGTCASGHGLGALCRKDGGAPGGLRQAPLHQDVSLPVSRVLYGSHRKRCERDGHSSATPIARRLKQPTRTAGPDRPARVRRRAPRRSYSVLLPVGFTVPPALPQTRCALTAPFHPCPEPIRNAVKAVCFSVALSLGSIPACAETGPPDVIRHRLSMEPGLSSPAPFRALPERPSGRLTA